MWSQSEKEGNDMTKRYGIFRITLRHAATEKYSPNSSASFLKRCQYKALIVSSLHSYSEAYDFDTCTANFDSPLLPLCTFILS
jgi:hypothetical protein